MNREEEITKAGFNNYPEDTTLRRIFEFGAEWADENPRKGIVDIDKVCNFLSNIDIKKYISSLSDSVWFVNIHIGDIIEDMKKAVEG